MRSPLARTRTGRIRGVGLALAALGALAACSPGGADADATGSGTEPGADAVTEAQRLYQIVNDNRAIDGELQEIEQRVAKRCMEDEGFDVHQPSAFPPADTTLYGAAGYLTGAPLRAVPTPEEAAEWGFGQWTDYVWSPENEQYKDELLTPEARAAFELPAEDYVEPDTSEWDAQGAEYQAEWIEAYTGAAVIEDSLKGPQEDSEAPMGGCELRMVETMYGEPYTVTETDDGENGEESYEFQVTHRPSPVYTIGEFQDFGSLYDEVAEQVVAFESCLIDAGYEGWELGEELFPPLWTYFGRMYDPAYFEEFGDEEGIETPEPPEDVPSDFLGVLELERAMAGDFAACGQDSGLREAIEQSWAAMLVDAYLPIETDLVAWQTEMQGHLDSAQDYLQE
ncbi:hypothetical protein [Glycomyces paridis]|uniref:Uncharacterized protein n=1 Tax=Glycomyces paridis TaxID=2126555 RepID=A0A4V4HNK9_9ACTN|nr:hypothetical protein [Glycomyces paridis]THV26446.1 hypothetical protein E9998_17960 [Glycomyces paridis]